MDEITTQDDRSMIRRTDTVVISARLAEDILERVDALIGPGHRSEFIRTSVREALERAERDPAEYILGHMKPPHDDRWIELIQHLYRKMDSWRDEVRGLFISFDEMRSVVDQERDEMKRMRNEVALIRASLALSLHAEPNRLERPR